MSEEIKNIKQYFKFDLESKGRLRDYLPYPDILTLEGRATVSFLPLEELMEYVDYLTNPNNKESDE
jgi:hypothetical protein